MTLSLITFDRLTCLLSIKCKTRFLRPPCFATGLCWALIAFFVQKWVFLTHQCKWTTVSPLIVFAFASLIAPASYQKKAQRTVATTFLFYLRRQFEVVQLFRFLLFLSGPKDRAVESSEIWAKAARAFLTVQRRGFICKIFLQRCSTVSPRDTFA